MCSIILQLKKFLLANFKDKSDASEQRDRKERQAQPNSHSEQKFKKTCFSLRAFLYQLLI